MLGMKPFGALGAGGRGGGGLGRRAALYLDFVNGMYTVNRQRRALADIMTIAGGVNGTRVNSAGLIEAATCPRFDYDPVTLAPLGVLIEEQRTNSILNGDTLDSGWSSDGTADLVLNQTISPTGAMTASQLQYVTNVYRYTTVATADATPYSYSLYPKLGTGGNNAIRMDVPGGGAAFNLATVTATPESGDTASIADAGEGWYRSVVNFDTSSTSTLVGIVMNGSFAAGQGHYFWGAQLEAGPFATSYIPTTGTAVTRTPDNLTMTGTDFSDWWNQAEGTIVVKFDCFATDADDNFIFSASDAAGADQVRLLVYAGAVYAQFTVGGVNVANLSMGSIDIGTHTFAVAYKANDFAACLDGGAVATDTSGAVPVVDRAGFGRYAAVSAGHLNGHLQAFAYEPRRLSNSMLQSLS